MDFTLTIENGGIAYVDTRREGPCQWKLTCEVRNERTGVKLTPSEARALARALELGADEAENRID